MKSLPSYYILLLSMLPQTMATLLIVTPPLLSRKILEDLALPAWSVGAYTGLIYCCASITTVASVRMMSVLGPLTLSGLCALSSGLSLIVFAAGSLVWGIIGALLLGLSYGPLTPASSQALASRSSTRTFALMMSVRQTSVPLGGVLGGLLLPSIVLDLGWQGAAFVVGSGVALLGLVLVFLAFRIERPHSTGNEAAATGLLTPLRYVAITPRLLTLAGAGIVYSASQLILSSFFVLYLVAAVGYDLVQAGVLFAISQVAGVMGRVTWGWIADRVPNPRELLAVIGGGMALSCVGAAWLTHLGPTPLAYPLAALYGLTASGWNGVYLAQIIREVPKPMAGHATSGTLFLTYIGIIVGPLLFGAAVEHVGYQGAYVGIATAAALGALLIVISKRSAG